MTEVAQPKPGSIHQISWRTFFLIPRSDIPESRQRTKDLLSIPGTRKLHSITSTGKKYGIKTRNLSCFCPECLSDNFTKCQNLEYVRTWEMKNIKQRQMESADNNQKDYEGKTVDNKRKATDNKEKTAGNKRKRACNKRQTAKTNEKTKCTNEKTANDKRKTSNQLVKRSLKLQVDKPNQCKSDQSQKSTIQAKNQTGKKDTADQQQLTALDVNAWVAVIYDDRWWPGIIQEVYNEKYKINFMKPVGDKFNQFIWPDEDDKDVAEVAQNEILLSIPIPPTPVSHRCFSFPPAISASIQSRMTAYLKDH